MSTLGRDLLPPRKGCRRKPPVFPVPRYFTQQPAPGCFHAVEFGTVYRSNGPTPGVTGEIYDVPQAFAEQRIRNVLANGRREMHLHHDGRIDDVYGEPGRAGLVVTRSKIWDWPKK